nr:hypothetical protein [Shigella flexneri]
MPYFLTRGVFINLNCQVTDHSGRLIVCEFSFLLDSTV